MFTPRTQWNLWLFNSKQKTSCCANDCPHPKQSKHTATEPQCILDFLEKKGSMWPSLLIGEIKAAFVFELRRPCFAKRDASTELFFLFKQRQRPKQVWVTFLLLYIFKFSLKFCFSGWQGFHSKFTQMASWLSQVIGAVHVYTLPPCQTFKTKWTWLSEPWRGSTCRGNFFLLILERCLRAITYISVSGLQH